MVPEAAVIVAVPPFTPVTTPLLLTVATLGADEVHVALLSAPVVPLLYSAVAASVTVEPTLTLAGFGWRAIEVKLGLLDELFAPAPPPQPAIAKIDSIASEDKQTLIRMQKDSLRRQCGEAHEQGGPVENTNRGADHMPKAWIEYLFVFSYLRLQRVREVKTVAHLEILKYSMTPNQQITGGLILGDLCRGENPQARSTPRSLSTYRRSQVVEQQT
jgi:hypothetical protein